MAQRKRSGSRRGGCGCPSGAKMISTKGRGRGFVCQAQSYKVNKKGTRYKPFVKALCR